MTVDCRTYDVLSEAREVAVDPEVRTLTVEENDFLGATLYGIGIYGSVFYGCTVELRTLFIEAEDRTFDVPFCTDGGVH